MLGEAATELDLRRVKAEAYIPPIGADTTTSSNAPESGAAAASWAETSEAAPRTTLATSRLATTRETSEFWLAADEDVGMIVVFRLD